MSQVTRPDHDAFPTSEGRSGITKREYFAAMALQGFCANPVDATTEENAAIAVQQADALIDALNTNPND